ncbi:MAG: Rieske 2Fe-2S domain-containing protein [Thermoprotei archaeon]
MYLKATLAMIRVCSLGELQRRRIVGFRRGGVRLVLIWYEGKAYCYEGLCPDRCGDLSAGQLHGRYLVCSCPYQQSVYDVTTGQALPESPLPTTLRSYATKAEEEGVFVELD